MFKKPAFPKPPPQPQPSAATTSSSAPPLTGNAPSSFAAWKQKQASAHKMPPPPLPRAVQQPQQPQQPQPQLQPQLQQRPQQPQPQPQAMPKDAPKLEYTVPKWACCPPKHPYFLEVLKNGVITRTIDISKKDHYVMGRLPTCDIPLENPTISRYHLVLQHKKDGRVLVYDLGSTHKTRINKHTVAPRTYTYYLTGDVLRLGESTQMYILNGGPPREEVMKELAAEEEKAKTAGCNWGMIGDDDEYDDADEEEEELPGRKRLTLGFEDNETSDSNNKKKQKNKGKKSLKRKRGEGEDNNSEEDNENSDGNGSEEGEDEEKEEQREVLVEKKFKKWETLENGERYIDSDDDEFYNRTGEVAKSRAKAIEREEREKGKGPEVLSYKDLLAKKNEIDEKLAGARAELAALKNEEGPSGNSNDDDDDDVDSLDKFMSENNDSLKNEKIRVLEECITNLEKEQTKTERYLEITRPTLQASADKCKKEFERKKLEQQQQYTKQEQPKALKVDDFFKDEEPAPKPQLQPQKAFQKQPHQPHQQQPTKAQRPAQQKYDDVDDWVPPSGQNGDGMTALNKRFGY